MKCSGTQNPSFIEIHYHEDSARTNCCQGCLCICLSFISQNDRANAATNQPEKKPLPVCNRHNAGGFSSELTLLQGQEESEDLDAFFFKFN